MWNSCNSHTRFPLVTAFLNYNEPSRVHAYNLISAHAWHICCIWWVSRQKECDKLKCKVFSLSFKCWVVTVLQYDFLSSSQSHPRWHQLKVSATSNLAMPLHITCKIFPSFVVIAPRSIMCLTAGAILGLVIAVIIFLLLLVLVIVFLLLLCCCFCPIRRRGQHCHENNVGGQLKCHRSVTKETFIFSILFA